jgi:chemotaxis signal transduction protein
MRKGQVGIMVYECKPVKRYSPSHVKQASEAKEKRNADFAILVTSAMKKHSRFLH